MNFLSVNLERALRKSDHVALEGSLDWRAGVSGRTKRYEERHEVFGSGMCKANSRSTCAETAQFVYVAAFERRRRPGVKVG